MKSCIREQKQPAVPSPFEGGRRPDEKGDGTAAAQTPAAVNPEVNPKKNYRRYSATYKLKILSELDRCQNQAEKGAILRREGLYSSLISEWNQTRNIGALDALNQLRGRKPQHDSKDKMISDLQKEIKDLNTRLAQADAILEIQKKVSALFGINQAESKQSESQ